MVKITATRELQVAGRRVRPGDTVEVSEKDAKIFLAVKRATYAAETQSPSALMATTMAAAVPEAAPEASPRPSSYRRRDMVAEPAGRTGAAPASRSSHRAPRPKAKT